MKTAKYILASALALAGMAMTSCTEKDEYFNEDYQSTPMSVSKIYLEDYKSSVPDREVEFARLGQTIRLEGKGFMGLKKIYINGYDTYFNRNMVSDNSMIVSINSKTPVVEAEEADRNKIRLVKDDAEFVYDFVIRAATPGVKKVSNTLPLAGETVTVYGNGLQEISSIQLPGGVTVTEGILSDDVDGEWFSFTMPDGVTEGGAIVATGANGIAQTPDYFNNRNCMIIDFDGTGVQGCWGGKDDDGNIKPGASMVYPEDLADDPLGGRGKVFQVVPDRLLADGISSAKSRATECWTAGNDDSFDDWTRMTEFIPAETPVTDFAFQFDVYCPEPWGTTGQIQICLINNYNWAGYTSDDNNSKSLTLFFLPWVENGEPFSCSEWTTVTIPFSEMGKYAAAIEDTETATPTMADVIADRNGSSYRNFGMGFVNSDFTFGGTEYKSEWFYGPKIYTDNWRVVPCKSVEISDYPEDEAE